MVALAAVLMIIPFIALAAVLVFGSILAWGVAHAIADRQREATRGRAAQPVDPAASPAQPVAEAQRLTA